MVTMHSPGLDTHHALCEPRYMTTHTAYTGGIPHWIDLASGVITFPRGTAKVDAQRAAEAIADAQGLTITGYAYTAPADADYVVRVPAMCAVCLTRAERYPGTGPCDAHSGDVWPTRKDN